jgi:hypothetical protein
VNQAARDVAGIAALILAACQSPSTELESMHNNSMRDLEGGDLLTPLGDDYGERQARRIERVYEISRSGGIESATDHYYAGLLLASSSRPQDLELARSMGLAAGEQGEERGFRIAAEAIDKGLRLKGEPQRYGTQISFVPVLKEWRLDPLDPRTTDEERCAMGVAPLAELTERERLLNLPHKLDAAGIQTP